MCGRFVLYATDEQLTESLVGTGTCGRDAFDGVAAGTDAEGCATHAGAGAAFADSVSFPLGMPPARYNIAPSTPVPIIIANQVLRGRIPAELLAGLGVPLAEIQDGENSKGDKTGAGAPAGVCVLPARWGLVPCWARELPRYATFNARVETAREKPTFRGAWSQRVIIPMNGYYEWRDGQPFYIHVPDRIVYAAGLFDLGLGQLSATMLTAPAEGPMIEVHHRMPMFVQGAAARRWLCGDADTPEFQVPEFVFQPVDKAVGNVAAQGEYLIAPLAG